MDDPRWTRLRPLAAHAWLAAHPDALRLDARAEADFVQGHIPGSLRLDGRNHEALLLRGERTRPVFIACYHGHASQTWARMFLDFGFATVADLDGGRAAWLREVPAPLAGWLAAQGFADAQARGTHGHTPLMQAAWRGRADLVAQLLALGVDLAAVNDDGNQALWLACVSGDAALVELLVRAGADLDHGNATGATCLMYAASSGKDALLRTLLALGADPARRTLDDFTALDMAATWPCLQLLRHAA